MKQIVFFLLFCAISWIVLAQEPRDKGVFIPYENEYWKHIKKTVDEFDAKPTEKSLPFKMDVSGKNFPIQMEEYHQVWANPSISQGNSGTCWCFCTTSFFESEIYRITGKQVKLSEMYTVYWEVVEKARRYVEQRGNSHFDEGSQANAVPRIWKKYGIVPAQAYTGKKPGQEFHNHEPMFGEMKKYLESLKQSNAWNEKAVIETICAILDHYMGKPPETIVVDGKSMSPKEYLESLSIPLDDYVNFMSLTQSPYYEMVEYKVPDNWWHSREYLNVPLEDFLWVLRNATRNGFSVCLGGDVSEPGYLFLSKVAVVPSFDIPSAYIDEHARQFRFSNQTTTDDHGIHCIGWLEKDGVNWYLIKDSGSGSRNRSSPGYLFYHEDFIKLKMMNIMVHKDAAKMVLDKYKAHIEKK